MSALVRMSPWPKNCETSGLLNRLVSAADDPPSRGRLPWPKVPFTGDGSGLACMPETGDGDAVRLSDLTVTRGGQRVVSDFTVTVPAGVVVGLLGPSGCGKSTLMRSIVGVQANVTGDVTVLGYPAGDPRLRSSIGYRAQELSVYEDLSVLENVEYFAALLRIDAVEGPVRT